MESPATDRPRQSILGFMGRRKRAVTTGTASPTSTSNPTTPIVLSPVGSPIIARSTSVARSTAPGQSSSRNSLLDPTSACRATGSRPTTPHAKSDDKLHAVLDSSLVAIGLVTQSSSRRNRDTARDAAGSRISRSTLRPASSATTTNTPSPSSSSSPAPVPKHHKLRFVPCLSPSGRSSSLQFEPIVRVVKIGRHGLTIGRYIDPATLGLGMDLFDFETVALMGASRNADDKKSDKVTFKSKVVSRMHAHMWVDESGQFWIKDTKSSSGTFVNHTRLSPPGHESAPHAIKDGDTIQLGVDYQGGREDIYRCVRMKVEVGRGREWQGGANVFNTSALQLIRSLRAANAAQDKENTPPISAATAAGPDAAKPSKDKNPKKAHAGAGDCAICLYPLTICQALFIAPCSHTFHFRCVRPLVDRHYPGFSCPLCRTFADLEADTEDTESLLGLEDIMNAEDEIGSRRDSLGDLGALPAQITSEDDPGDGGESPERTRQSEIVDQRLVPEADGLRRALEASRVDIVKNSRHSLPSLASPETFEPGGTLSNANLLGTQATTASETAPEGMPHSSDPIRELFAIKTSFSPPTISNGEPSRNPFDFFLTAVSPQSNNPFQAYGSINNDVTPPMTPITSPRQSNHFDMPRERSNGPSDSMRAVFLRKAVEAISPLVQAAGSSQIGDGVESPNTASDRMED
ncbi:hypothetical protein FRB94_004749 [Tulasnella sp. JGI-2019a]|nr:hypothetical protein FRB93_011405 [Tulasnella sp. JGI-2019a]KAG9012939.1 hypothetical protein FRB94_004749 [Tulasnella sp. JGI-2019a]